LFGNVAGPMLARAKFGPPVGCLPEELTQDEAWARAAGAADSES
jgi:hypothetical protein